MMYPTISMLAEDIMTMLDRPVAHQAQAAQRPPEIWTLTLNRYQRDNLLWLLNRIGYPWDNPHRVDDLGELANAGGPRSLQGDGDWLGEIAQMLAKVEAWKDGRPVVVMAVDENDHPNAYVERPTS